MIDVRAVKLFCLFSVYYYKRTSVKMQDNKQLGKFYTTSNPFELKPFLEWFNNIPSKDKKTILEPFAGSNHIVKSVDCSNEWKCFDIRPTENLVEKFPITQRDTISDFPQGFDICITNPPYLAKNSVTRNKLEYRGGEFDDLYKQCLDIILKNCKYVAVIIPESFITSDFDKSRLTSVISLTCRMFDDTECPVCLAMFNETTSDDFSIYIMDEFVGTYNELVLCKPKHFGGFDWKINDPTGEIGLICIDKTTSDDIHFCHGDEIPSENIKISSRSYTRISIDNITIVDYENFFHKCNEFIKDYRLKTYDIFFTSFKNLQKCGKYRRRLDFNTAKRIMETVLTENPQLYDHTK